MSRPVAVVLVVAAALALPGAISAAEDAAAPDLATILARHAAARGGAERWSAVRTLEITGTWEAFSTPGPFTVQRAAPDRFRFDHVLFGQPATFAYDGEHAWIQGAALGVPEPVRLDDAWKRNLIEDAALRTPLLAGPSESVALALVGPAVVDGIDTWAVDVTREGFPKETWYLDAKSYLEVKRESMTFDVFSGGIEIPMETFYDDFRTVEGLVLPFHEERHFGTRYHVTDIAAVRVDAKIDPARFAAPPPPPPAPEGEAAGGGS